MTDPDEHLHRVKRIVADIRFREDNIMYVGYFAGSRVVYLQHRYMRKDAITGKDEWGYGRKWHISEFATESEIVLTALKAAITNMEHEVREDFEYKGVKIFQPHVDVNVLAQTSAFSDARPAPPTDAERAEVIG
jgi:hypothetical protein